MDKISVLNIDICSIELPELLTKINKGVLLTPNVDHLIKLQKDTDFFECYQAADWVIFDSNIVNLAAKFLGNPFKEVIPGSSFLPAFYNHHKDNLAIKIFLLGAPEGVAETARKRINAHVKRNMVIGAYSPTFGFEKNEEECREIVEMIKASNANVLVVGVGAPKQEKWIMKYKHELPNINLFMALGATLDFEAGNIKRAPLVFQKLHVEWLYRLIKEPKRLWKRYLVEDMSFFSTYPPAKARDL